MLFFNLTIMNKNHIIGFTCSCFDLLHAGHILMLKDAKDQCDYLIVGLQTDPTIDRPDSKKKPVQTLEERKIQLEAIKYINEVIVYSSEKNLYNLLIRLNPDIRILGSDYKGKAFTGDDLKIKVYFHNRDHNFSTSNLRNIIKSQK